MHLQSGKALNKMTKSAYTGASMSSQSLKSSSQAKITQTSTPAVGASVPTTLGATMAMPLSIDMEVTAPTTAPTVIAQMTQPEMGTFVPPFTARVPVTTSVPTSPNPQVKTRFEDRLINIENSSRDQPYGMPTSMMEKLHNIPAFIEHANPFTPFNTHSPSISCGFGRSALPAFTI